MRLIDPTKTRDRTERTEHGSNITYTDHHDGSVDATVRITALRIFSGAPPVKELVYAVAELEAAQKEHTIAKHSDNSDWMRYTANRIRAANLHIQEVQ